MKFTVLVIYMLQVDIGESWIGCRFPKEIWFWVVLTCWPGY